MNNFIPEAAPAAAALSSFALLRLDQTRLLIPQTDVRVLDLTMDMSWDNPPPGGVGWIRFNAQQLPVYSPSSRLEWLNEVPADRTLCALMEAENTLFGLLCTEVTLVKSENLQLHPLPAAMATPDAPFHQLALHERKLACLSSATKIYAQLPRQGSEQ